MSLPVPSQRTWTVGDIVTAAEMNANVRDAVNFLSNPPIAVLYQATSQSIPNNANTTITFDGEVVDSYGGHSNSSNPGTYFAQVAGWYFIIGDLWFNSNATGYRRTDLLINGSLPGNATPTSTDAPPTGIGESMQVTTFQYLNVGDTVIMQGTQTSGGALNTSGGASSLTLLWIHA